MVVLTDSGQLESKASQLSFPLPPVLLAGLEHAIDNTGDPLHDTPERMLFGFTLFELLLKEGFGFRMPPDLIQRNPVEGRIQASIPLGILHVAFLSAGAFLFGSNSCILQKFTDTVEPFNTAYSRNQFCWRL